MPNLTYTEEHIITCTDNDSGQVIYTSDETSSYNPQILLVFDSLLSIAGVVIADDILNNWKTFYVSVGKIPSKIAIQVVFTINTISSRIFLYSGDIYCVSRGMTLDGVGGFSNLTSITILPQQVGNYPIKYVLTGASPI